MLSRGMTTNCRFFNIIRTVSGLHPHTESGMREAELVYNAGNGLTGRAQPCPRLFLSGTPQSARLENKAVVYGMQAISSFYQRRDQ